MQDVIAGHVQMMFASVSPAKPTDRERQAPGAGGDDAQAHRLAPDNGSVAELAIPNFEATAWHALVGPAALPKDVLTTVHKAMMATSKDPATSKQLTGLGLDVMPTTPEALTAYIKAENPKWSALIKGVRCYTGMKQTDCHLFLKAEGQQR